MENRHKFATIPVTLLMLVVVGALTSQTAMARNLHDKSTAATDYYYFQRAPSKLAIMFKGYLYTDPDLSIYNDLIRTCREKGVE
jgi:hypothetical protein